MQTYDLLEDEPGDEKPPIMDDGQSRSPVEDDAYAWKSMEEAAQLEQTICAYCRWSIFPTEKPDYVRCSHPRVQPARAVDIITGDDITPFSPECAEINDGHCGGFTAREQVAVPASFLSGLRRFCGATMEAFGRSSPLLIGNAIALAFMAGVAYAVFSGTVALLHWMRSLLPF